jgi:hypothetical protein
VEAAGCGERPVDRCFRDTVVRDIEEPDILTGVSNFGGNAVKRSWHSGEIGAVVDDRD